MLVTLGLALAVAACGASTTSPTTTSSTSVRKDVAGLFGRRYCELILVQAHTVPLTAEVWNTYPLNNCPESTWLAIDPAKVAKQRGAVAVLRNGPRFWAVDGITKYSSAPLRTVDLGGLGMHPDAVLALGTLDPTPYVTHAVERNTVFSYRSGRRIYELHAADGSTFVMQSWSEQIDPTLTERDLAGLASRLSLPAGWTYRWRVLAAPLRVVSTATPALVLQDNLGNSYSKES